MNSICSPLCFLARPAGFEPAALRFVVCKYLSFPFYIQYVIMYYLSMINIVLYNVFSICYILNSHNICLQYVYNSVNF